MDLAKLELIKNKKEDARSAIASQEVREHLADFILAKRSFNQLNGCAQTASSSSATAAAAALVGPTKQCSLDNKTNVVATEALKLNSQLEVSASNSALTNEDHPLRKTASMPTMHIPCKAQSLAKRKQMERRTTLSPLMGRRWRTNRRKLVMQSQSTASSQQQQQQMNRTSCTTSSSTTTSTSTIRGKFNASASCEIDATNYNANNGLTFAGLPAGNRQWAIGGDEFRQRSLDCGELSRATAFAELPMGGQSLKRLARQLNDTSDAITGQAVISGGCLSRFATKPSAMTSAQRIKQQSSSSSSTSSLLSQQDSCEDSSSFQAIDLSDKQRRLKFPLRHQTLASASAATAATLAAAAAASAVTNASLAAANNCNATSGAQTQQMLQDSFDQLNLCASRQLSRETIQRLLRPNDDKQQLLATDASINISGININDRRCVANALGISMPQTSTELQNASLFGSLPSQLMSTSLDSDKVINATSVANHELQRRYEYDAWIRGRLALASASRAAASLDRQLVGELSTLPESLLAACEHARNYAHNTNVELLKQEALAQKSLIGRTLSSPLLPAFSNSQTALAAAAAVAAAAASVTTTTANVNNQRVSLDYQRSLRAEMSSVERADTDSSLDLSSTQNASSSFSSASVGKSGDSSFAPTTAAAATTVDRQLEFVADLEFSANSKTGITFDLAFCNHKCICRNDNNHPENSNRVLAIWRRLAQRGLMAKCARIATRAATLDELRLCHNETYCSYFATTPYERLQLSQFDLSKLAIEGLMQLECGGLGVDVDTAWDEHLTPLVARIAVGCTIEAATQVALGKLNNAFAIVRPPGHHAEYQHAMGFCFFNNVAIAAQVLETNFFLTRILIVDIDIHHGNGTQKMFYASDSVLTISIHKHDGGSFFPGTGFASEIGVARGEGYNWNVAWFDDQMGDSEYMAAFRSLVLPIARDFRPEIVIVACGFDASVRHPKNFGGYKLSAACFGWMTQQLCLVNNGRVVLCLEGGYELEPIADCAEQCVRALLGEPLTERIEAVELTRRPVRSAVQLLEQVTSLAVKFWPSVERHRRTIDVSMAEVATTLQALSEQH